MDDLELVARYIAARKMGLAKDVYGHGLPITLWSQCEAQAADLLKLYPLEVQERREAVRGRLSVAL